MAFAGVRAARRRPLKSGPALVLVLLYCTLWAALPGPRAFAPAGLPRSGGGAPVGLAGRSAAAAAGAFEAPAGGTAPAGPAAFGVAVLCAAALLGAAGQRRGAASAGAGARQPKTARQARGGAAEKPLVVIAGPPAAGKGTQCEKIKAQFGYVHISTGDILRENVKNGTELGTKAKEYMEAGALVPSELIVDLVKDRLAQDDIREKGCLLDGFPRAPDQAQAMADAGIAVDRFLLIKVPDDTLVERGCGRRLDPETGDIYHMKFKPPPEDIVERLVHRKDDQEDTIRARLQAYHSQIDGILPFFKEAVVEVDGTGKPDEVFGLVSDGLDGL